MTPEVKKRIDQIRHGIVPEGYIGSKIGVIPQEWRTNSLGELGESKNGLNFHRNDEGYAIRVLGVGDFKEKTVMSNLEGLSKVPLSSEPGEEFLLQNGDIVFVRSNGSRDLVGRNLLVYPNDKKVSYSGFCIRYRTNNSDLVAPKYLNFIFDSGVLKKKLEKENQGSNIKNLNQDILSDLTVAFPSDKKEQANILQILSLQNKTIELKEKLLTEKQRQKKYLMQVLLSGKKRVPGFSGKWASLPASQIFKNVSDKKHDGTLEVLSATQDRGIVPRSQVDIDIKYAEESLSGYKKVEQGNFVISLRSFQGGIEYSEYSGIVSPAYTVLASILPIENSFYRQYFKSADYVNRLNIAVYGIRDGKQISYSDFGRIKIPYPLLNEQKAIAEILTAADIEVDVLKRSIEQQKQQKKALMQLLLTGIVRVKR